MLPSITVGSTVFAIELEIAVTVTEPRITVGSGVAETAGTEAGDTDTLPSSIVGSVFEATDTAASGETEISP